MAAQTEPAVYHKTWTIDPEPEHIDFFLAALKTYREELIKEPTVLYFNAFRDQTKSGVFRFVFIYDADPMQVGEMFLNAAYSKKFSREVDTILTEPTTTEILGPVEGLKFVKGS